MRASILMLVAAGAVALAGCQKTDKGVAGVCKPFPAANAPPAADGASVLEDCLHRWAYTLAGGRDDATTVATAVMAACTAPLARWNQQSLGAADGRPAQAPSLLTGEPTNPLAEHSVFAQSRALFYVVQARAGHCRPPPRRAAQPAMNAPER